MDREQQAAIERETEVRSEVDGHMKAAIELCEREGWDHIPGTLFAALHGRLSEQGY